MKILLLVFIFQASCAAYQQDVRLGRYYFGYDVGYRERTELIQVFDDGESMYLQFLNADDVYVVDERGEEVQSELDGQYLKIPRIYYYLEVFSESRNSIISRHIEEPKL